MRQVDEDQPLNTVQKNERTEAFCLDHQCFLDSCWFPTHSCTIANKQPLILAIESKFDVGASISESGVCLQHTTMIVFFIWVKAAPVLCLEL
jgi:hypothetical protein